MRRQKIYPGQEFFGTKGTEYTNTAKVILETYPTLQFR